MTESSLHLTNGPASATIALRGAEPVSWRVGGRELLWQGDPAHWGFSAPILFPVVGASKAGVLRVDGVDHPMGQHGFARRSDFTCVEQVEARVHLRMSETDETLAAYPFRFGLDVVVELGADSLTQHVTVANTGARPMPYALGVHPAFNWPFDAPDRDGHRVVFAAPEAADLPEIAAGGLLARATRRVPLDGTVLPLSPELFTEALVILDARSRSLRFVAPGGAAIELAGDSFPHLAVWTKPDAPFLSLEAWTGHADWEDASGDLFDRASMIHLPPGGTGRHRITMSFHPA